MSTMY